MIYRTIKCNFSDNRENTFANRYLLLKRKIKNGIIHDMFPCHLHSMAKERMYSAQYIIQLSQKDPSSYFIPVT